MSGLYDMKRLTGGYSDAQRLRLQPVGLHAATSRIRRGSRRSGGRTSSWPSAGTIPSCENNRRLSAALWDKGIGNALRVWDGWAHDWPYWERMIRLYIGGHD